MYRLLVLSALLAAQVSSQATDEISGLGWIAGAWSGPTGRAQTEEHWIQPAGGAMLGVSRTIAGERMVAFEFLRIEKRADGIFYVAQPQGRPPTDFKLTRSGPRLAVFENPNHDHPKIIRYEMEDAETLVATVEGDQGGRNTKAVFRWKRILR